MPRQRPLSTSEAAALLGITPEGVLDLIRRERLKAHEMKSVPSPRGGRTPYGIWLRDLQAFQATRRPYRRRSSVDQGPLGGSAEIVSGRVEPAQG